MIRVEFLDRRWISTVDSTKQIFRLMLQLIEIGTNRKVTILTTVYRHNEPPLVTARCPLGSGERRFALEPVVT